MNAIQPRPFQQPRSVDRMSARLLTSQADSIRDMAVALGTSQNSQADANGVYSATLLGRDSIRYTKDSEGKISSVELNADTATPTRFSFETGQWPHLTTVTVGSDTFDVQGSDHVGWSTPGEEVKLEAPLAELLKGNGYSTRDLAVALDNSSADQAPGIGWVQVPGEGNTTWNYPVSFQYDRDGKVSDLATSVGDYTRAEYSFFDGELNSVAQRNSSYITKDNNVFDFHEGRNRAFRYAAWVEEHQIKE
ncbi:MAG: hypothetical protein J0I12_23545 [Candidatus Eremiobacteraeota bacterium]|nr:hypothetical protein [Candidatus Eremiobacteraeota bacterium]